MQFGSILKKFFVQPQYCIITCGTSNSNRNQTKMNNKNNLILNKICGGSIIDIKPLFSNDGETIFTVEKNTHIKAYNTSTSELVKEFESAVHKIVGLVQDPSSPDWIVACLENGEIVHWDTVSGAITAKDELNILQDVKNNEKDMKIKTFNFVTSRDFNGKEVQYVLLTSSVDTYTGKTVQVALYDLLTGSKISKYIFRDIPGDYYVSIVHNYGDNIIVFGYDTWICLSNSALIFNKHKTTCPITCLCGHPEEATVAVGDSLGRVIVWKDLLNIPAKATYHWHSLPVTDIAFSSSGKEMFTGGGEAVLVKWILAKPQDRRYLPRLPAMIKHISIAPDNVLIAISTLDNGIMITDYDRKIKAVIQNFTRDLSGSSLYSAGICEDSRSGSVVLNSRIGHIQFIRPVSKSLLYNLDITQENIISQERNMKITNTTVTKIAVSSNGNWLATIEEREGSFMEVRLKFWEFKKTQQTYELNTVIEDPHVKGVNSLKFRPKTEDCDSDSEFLVSTGKDKKFKVWYLADGATIECSKNYWRSCGSNNYCEEIPEDASYVTDGSVLGVAFGSSLTLWSSKTLAFKGALEHMKFPQTLKRIEFGTKDCCHLAVVASNEHLAVWDLTSFRLKWVAHINLAVLAADPRSTYMAAFTTDNKLIVFNPKSAKPIYEMESVVNSEISIMSACFVRNQEAKNNTVDWQKESKLVFLTSEQELLNLDSEFESNVALENLSVSKNLPLTSFSRLIAAERISAVEKPKAAVNQDYGSYKTLCEELFNNSANSMPPMSNLCSQFLLQLLKLNSSQNNEE
ncbi:WD repeat-containing protein 75 [Trichogramma pretiosum]|uniref:WD repeat-containing protein 75 n=1 Tax=Trichogramma pretiosum TaxID=7493 RepID=UPI0006C98A3E|nr:WD repeat-containing protein 75 [Trichogramma pretiosum]